MSIILSPPCHRIVEMSLKEQVIAEQALADAVKMTYCVPSDATPASGIGQSADTDERGFHMPRPPNEFMLYRKAHYTNEKESLDGMTAAKYSGKIGLQWQNEPPEIKAIWKKAADQVKRSHKIKYPNYKFRPQQKAGKGTTRRNHIPLSEEKEKEDATEEPNGSNTAPFAPHAFSLVVPTASTSTSLSNLVASSDLRASSSRARPSQLPSQSSLRVSSNTRAGKARKAPYPTSSTTTTAIRPILATTSRPSTGYSTVPTVDPRLLSAPSSSLPTAPRSAWNPYAQASTLDPALYPYFYGASSRDAMALPGLYTSNAGGYYSTGTQSSLTTPNTLYPMSQTADMSLAQTAMWGLDNDASYELSASLPAMNSAETFGTNTANLYAPNMGYVAGQSSVWNSTPLASNFQADTNFMNSNIYQQMDSGFSFLF